MIELVALHNVDIMSNSSADEFFAPGHILTLSLTIDQAIFECKASILQPFQPFTKSQILLVELQPPISGIPSPVILKIYDPRFINDRVRRRRPWSLSLEVAAAERREAIARNERLDDYDEENWIDFDEVLCEEDFYRTANERFNSELAAYFRLQDLQGDGIPRYYASGNLAVDPLRPISPHVLVLEYIPGESLSTINPRSVSRSMARSLITIVRSFASHGVNHGDINPGNILFSSRQPSQVVVIDFGECFFRRDEASDSEWRSIVEVEGDETWVNQQLDKAGIRDLDPHLPKIYPGPDGAEGRNSYGEREGKRWCVPTEEWMGPGGVKLDEPIRWKLRDDVAAWLAAKEVGLLTGIDPPRPGSPDYVSVIPATYHSML
jgi:serine/threonine protein kinase